MQPSIGNTGAEDAAFREGSASEVLVGGTGDGVWKASVVGSVDVVIFFSTLFTALSIVLCRDP